ncbi:MAG TPA: HAMP domain-containing sensor histidine kinase [Kofleriaceae bacterium]|nr:HAMP domain-containing sensor histidine kinase [Kofleriaceae bacterium]
MLAITTGAIAALALIAVAAMVWLTTVLHRTTSTAAAAVESVYLLEEAEIDLLLHARATTPLMARDLESSLRERLAAARAYVGSLDGLRALEEATSRIAAYLARAGARGAPPIEVEALHSEAYAALEALVARKLAQARAQDADARRWDRLADAVAIALGILLVGIAVAVIVWLRWRAFRPVLGLADAMQRFGGGDRGARAEETGPAELREMSARFNELAQALVTQREAQLAMLAGVAHDLRQPLSALALATNMLDPESMTAAQMRRPIEISRRQIDQLKRMVGDFLDLARLDAAQLELELRREDVRELVGHVVDLLDGTVSRARIALRLPAEPVHARCDAMRIEQAIGNLVSNAIKYSPVDAPVDITVEVRGEEIAICVTDRGPGLSADEQARLFEPFRRVGTAAREAPGIGLGLYVVRRILIAHGGRIEIESERGRGATFSAYLPLG